MARSSRGLRGWRLGLWLFGIGVVSLVGFAGCDGGEPGADAGPESVDAGRPDAGPTGFFDCDPRNVTCDSPTPMCMTGFVPIVESACWGACQQAAGCYPIMCEEATQATDCPSGWGCVLQACRPPR